MIMTNKIYSWYQHNIKIIFVSLMVGLVITFGTMWTTKAYSETIQEGIASEVIRFHVLANSDSKEDQALKLKVRDAILDQFSYKFDGSKDIAQSRKIIQENLSAIERCARDVIEREGYTYGVKASLSKSIFPTKQYANVKFPPGEYEALRVVIGEGKGKNWFCVMFPPLCFVDETHSKISEKTAQELRTVLTADEYNLVVDADGDRALPVKVKFKIVEWWQEKKFEYALSKNN